MQIKQMGPKHVAKQYKKETCYMHALIVLFITDSGRDVRNRFCNVVCSLEGVG